MYIFQTQLSDTARKMQQTVRFQTYKKTTTKKTKKKTVAKQFSTKSQQPEIRLYRPKLKDFFSHY